MNVEANSIHMFGIFWIIMGTAILVLAGMFVFWVWMVVDCAKRNFPEKNKWLIILVLGYIVSAVFYFFMVKLKNQK